MKFDERLKRHYFVNHNTKSTQWEDPRPPIVLAKAAQAMGSAMGVGGKVGQSIALCLVLALALACGRSLCPAVFTSLLAHWSASVCEQEEGKTKVYSTGNDEHDKEWSVSRLSFARVAVCVCVLSVDVSLESRRLQVQGRATDGARRQNISARCVCVCVHLGLCVCVRTLVSVSACLPFRLYACVRLCRLGLLRFCPAVCLLLCRRGNSAEFDTRKTQNLRRTARASASLSLPSCKFTFFFR